MNSMNGFYEYGIMALLGAVSMLGFYIWALATDATPMDKESSQESDQITAVSDHRPLEKAA